jgi:ATP-dependent Clp protease ATP-binding subunit ClpA
MLKDIKGEIEALGASFEITDGAKSRIVTEGYVHKYGARPMRRTIQNRIENPAAEFIIRDEIRKGCKVKVDTDENGCIRVSVC